MQPLGVVDVLDEAADVGHGLCERPVLLQVDFLALQGLEEALGLGILVRIAHGRHADPCPDARQLGIEHDWTITFVNPISSAPNDSVK